MDVPTPNTSLSTDPEPALPPQLAGPVTEQATQPSHPDGWALAGFTPAARSDGTRPEPPRAGGRGIGALIGASVLSAVLASTGTVAILTGAIGAPPVTSTPPANGRTVTTI